MSNNLSRFPPKPQSVYADQSGVKSYTLNELLALGDFGKEPETLPLPLDVDNVYLPCTARNRCGRCGRCKQIGV